MLEFAVRPCNMLNQQLRTDQWIPVAMALDSDDKNSKIEYLESEQTDRESSPSKFNIVTYPVDYTLEILYNKLERNEIQTPNFQRNFVWTQNQSSKLIESFLLNLPVPAIFLYNEPKTSNYLILDGQQRLKSIHYYIKGVFDQESSNDGGAFHLTGLAKDSQYNNLAYSDLSATDQQFLSNSVLRGYIVKQLESYDDLSKYYIFERLNTGGTSLENQEIRDCTYFGKFSIMLSEMNHGSKWRSIFGTNNLDKRKRDIELILRFLALRDFSDYSPSMKDYLSNFMKRYQNADQEQLSQFSLIFEKTCNSIVAHLGEKPFHGSSISRLNVALLDAVMVAFSNHTESIPKDIKGRFGILLDNKDFIDGTRLHTTDRQTVLARFNLAEEILFSN